ncbi:hypothetical protein MOQ72_11385 [Saccharopolyspora sp. K220]|uniref:hypothetical protein n=1 Tax=Saccharopolyspora soli TaxID=2926618 RepID=UPI001F5AFAD2|nr:hypothetical protein [Saccharopolyspora soli]MCI2418028.1 hypothetical protein [Saccharopolyspora soli]
MSETPANRGIAVSRLSEGLEQRWLRRNRFGRFPDQPVVHLLRDTDADALITQLSEHFGRTVPHAELDVGAAPNSSDREQSAQLREQLADAALALLEHDSRRRIGRLRFPRYSLLVWLLKQNQPRRELIHQPQGVIRESLHAYLRRRWKRTRQSEHRSAAWAAAAGQLPWYLLLVSLSILPLYYALWVRWGSAPRWFMRQRYLAPRESADFPSFAQRLMTTPSQWESPEEVRKLLVHAFLTDLAVVHTRRPWRWRWVSKDCYPVLLLRNLRPGTIGETLVKLLNDVRNETGAPDPLLVVAAGEQQLRDAPVLHESGTLKEWQANLEAARRRRSPTAWYVPLRISEAPVDEEQSNPLGRAVPRLKHSKLLRRIPVILIILLVFGSTGGYFEHRSNHCGIWTPWRNPDLWWQDAEPEPAQNADDGPQDSGTCIGISDGTYFFLTDIPDSVRPQEDIEQEKLLRGLQENIAQQNALAVDSHQRDPVRRPLVTVIYFSTLTIRDLDSSTLAGVANELQGLIAAQEEARGANVPMRILLANGGEGMRHGRLVADRIVDFAARSTAAPVIGVVGLGGSWKETKDSIKALEPAALPVIGTVTSASDLPESSRLYHQVGPSNKREAEVVAAYLLHNKTDENGQLRPPDGVTVFFAKGDHYSENLAANLAEQLTSKVTRFKAESGDPSEVEIPCGPQETVFFAGRTDDLSDFLSKVEGDCSLHPNAYPHLMAGDDATQVKLDQEMAGRPGVSVDYVSFDDVPKQNSPTPGQSSPTLRGRALLAFDAVKLLYFAVDKVKTTDSRIPLTGATVWRGIAEFNGANPFPGSSGAIDFGTPSGQVPVDKAISVLRKTSGTPEPGYVLVCGRGVHPTGRCPAPT